MELSSHHSDPTEIYRLTAALLAVLAYSAIVAVYVGRRQPGRVALPWAVLMALVLAVLSMGRPDDFGRSWLAFAGVVIVLLGVPCALSAVALWWMQGGRTPWPPLGRAATMVGMLVLSLLTWGSMVTIVLGYLF
jgi:hypothetical protein